MQAMKQEATKPPSALEDEGVSVAIKVKSSSHFLNC